MKKRNVVVVFQDGDLGVFSVLLLLWAVACVKHGRINAYFHATPLAVMFEKEILTVDDLNDMLEDASVQLPFGEMKKIAEVRCVNDETPDYKNDDLRGS